MRHGQTLFNFKGLIQGFGDSPLTELGIAQAQKARSYYETKGDKLRFICIINARTRK